MGHKHLEDAREYKRKWRAKNLVHHRKYNKKWRVENLEQARLSDQVWRDANPQYSAQQSRKYIAEHPWYGSYKNAYQRCNNPNNNRYYIYGARGVEFQMTTRDFEHLWFRDHAFLMDRPSIDRIDNDGHYVLDNCRFIEKPQNTKHARQ